METMDDLKKIIVELNENLSKMGQKLFTKKNEDENEKISEKEENGQKN
jgi:hypothetical protein